MKLGKFIALLLVSTMLFSAFAYADGNPNIDGGDGETEDGDVAGGSFWNLGNDGVRVTIVDDDGYNNKVSQSVDFSNVSPPTDITHFQYKSKLHYKSHSLSIKMDGYSAIIPDAPLPTIITAGGGANIGAVKRYFAMEGTIKDIATQTGFDYDTLISGEYVIMLEPVIYFSFNGIKYAMTATEAALFDRVKNGELKAKLGYATHQNLPLAMFLETPDLGYPAWSGPRTGIRTDSEIITSLGIGTVRFREGELQPPDNPDPPGVKRYSYRTDTDVITTIKVRNSSDKGIDPDKNAEVVFTIDGVRYRKRFVTPPNEETPIWVRWHTPTSSQEVTVTVSSSHGEVLTPTVICDVGELVEATPPDPQGRDQPPFAYTVPWEPRSEGVRALAWGEWKPYYVENWVWEADNDWVEGSCGTDCAPDCDSSHGHWEDNGQWVDEGWWNYDWEEYSVRLSLKTVVQPDGEVPTAKLSQATAVWDMKSGYGVDIGVTAKVETDGKTADVTCAQNTIAQFPEFNYGDYFRILEPTPNGLNASFALRFNKYSYKGASVHYTPLWFPDRSNYAPKVTVFDVWTPAGQLYYTDTDFVTINGDVYDDWNIAPVRNDE